MPDSTPQTAPATNRSGSTRSVAIVGGGFGGLGTAIELKKLGITDFVIFERGDSVGGVWRANTYPGAACDVPSHLYSLSSARGYNWSRRYAPQADIYAYMQDIVEDHDLAQHLRLNTEVESATFDTAAQQWVIKTAAGDEQTFDLLVTACGQLTNPVIPNLPGRESFQGTAFHSAQWNHDYDLSGKHVAVIGTGASAIQFVPHVAAQAADVKVFQRTPPWILPKSDRKYYGWERWLFKHFPPRVAASRAGIFVFMEFFARAFLGKPWAQAPMRWIANTYRNIALRGDAELKEACTPDYEFGCSRVLFTSDWYPTVQRDNVDLINYSVKEITAEGVTDERGNTHPVDAIIYGTGFAGGDFVAPMDIIGADGQHLDQVWGDTPAAYLGITVPRFPNMFILYGPNTNHGSASVPYTLECQIRYVMDGIKQLRARDADTLDVKPEALAAWRKEMDDRSKNTAWTRGGCGNWYVNERGENTNNWPGAWLEYKRRTKTLDADKYEFA